MSVDGRSAQRILVIKSRHIGDVLLTAPLLTVLKQRWPDASLTVLVKRGTEAMLENHPEVDQVLCFPVKDPGEGKWRYLWRSVRFMRGLARYGFDLAINTTEGDRGVFAAWFSRARLRYGVALPGERRRIHRLLTHVHEPRPGRVHTVLRNLEIFVPEAERAALRPLVTMGVADEDAEALQALLDTTLTDEQRDRPWVLVHPTSRWLFKCWHNKGMAEVIDHLHERGFCVFLTAGPDQREAQRVKDILHLCKSRPVNLSGRLSLGQLAALAARCKMFFGVDSAPMHMAAALDVPVVAIFGPSGAFDWGPWPNCWHGGDTPYPQVAGVQHAGVHRVIQDMRGCVPCGKAGCNDSKHSACLDELASETVLQQIDEQIGMLEFSESREG